MSHCRITYEAELTHIERLKRNNADINEGAIIYNRAQWISKKRGAA